MIKEVKNKRFAGPFDQIPYKNYIQLPVGLVPKAGGQTRQIFHLSYTFKNGGPSVNSQIPCHKCMVKYQDLDHTIDSCIQLLKDNPNADLWMGVSDLKSAFRMVPLSPKWWAILTMKAHNPKTGKWAYFVDKCLPFGASISCAIFQRWSNALTHLAHFELRYKVIQRAISNYLDDFLNFALVKQHCNKMLTTFHKLCAELGVPIAKEKTVWASLMVVFLGILLDGKNKLLALPIEKICKATYLLRLMLNNKKATVKDIQRITGLLNFMGRAIYPGCTFTRRMYSKITNKMQNLKEYHHVNLEHEFRADCMVWLRFLSQNNTSGKGIYRPFVDRNRVIDAEELSFYTDSSKAKTLGFGGVFKNQFWFVGQWEKSYIKTHDPSIEYLELYAVVMGVYLWADHLRDRVVLIHCDNQAVVAMVNNIPSGCKHCMHLIWLLVLKSLEYNFKIAATYVKSKLNDLADSLSRLQFARFCRLAPPSMSKKSKTLSIELWPASKIWNGFHNTMY